MPGPQVKREGMRFWILLLIVTFSVFSHLLNEVGPACHSCFIAGSVKVQMGSKCQSPLIRNKTGAQKQEGNNTDVAILWWKCRFHSIWKMEILSGGHREHRWGRYSKPFQSVCLSAIWKRVFPHLLELLDLVQSHRSGRTWPRLPLEKDSGKCNPTILPTMQNRIGQKEERRPKLMTDRLVHEA